MGLIPGWGTKIPQVLWPKKEKKKKDPKELVAGVGGERPWVSGGRVFQAEGTAIRRS